MQEYIAMWKNYANFHDRTSVRGYWMVFLINVAISLVLGLISLVIPFLGILTTLYAIAALIPGLAISVRRLRDTNRNWTCLFIALIPIVGVILLIVWLCQPTSNWQGLQV